MIVQMSERAYLGRFGNQLFGYFFLKVLEAELGCEIRYPAWAGNTLFNLPATPGLLVPDESICFEELPRPDGFTLVHGASRENGPDTEIAAIGRYSEARTNVLEVAGYFQYHSSTLAKWGDLFFRTFQFDQQLERRLHESLARFGLAGNPIVCVHVRRGGYLLYGNNHKIFWGNSFDAIVKAVADLKQGYFKNFFVYLCSDDVDYCKRELEARSVNCITSAELLGGRDASQELMADFLVMARSNALLIANSSFSFAAAMLNRNSRIFLRPCPTEDRYIPFDPWNSHVLLPKYL